MSYVRFPELMPRHRRHWLQTYLEESLQRSRVILAISHFTRQELLDCFPSLDPSRVFTTPLGVDHDEFHPRRADEETACLRRRHELPERFLLYLGTLEPRKNLQGLLAAYALLPQPFRREFPLVIAGQSGWQEHRFRRTIARFEAEHCLKCLGYVAQEDVPGLLRAAEALCFPSLYEGFGLPPLEAAACGTAVICSHASSLPEVMGEAAEYVNPEDPESIAEGILHVLQDDSYRRSLARGGPAQAAAFTWERCGTATLKAYREAA